MIIFTFSLCFQFIPLELRSAASTLAAVVDCSSSIIMILRCLIRISKVKSKHETRSSQTHCTREPIGKQITLGKYLLGFLSWRISVLISVSEFCLIAVRSPCLSLCSLSNYYCFDTFVCQGQINPIPLCIRMRGMAMSNIVAKFVIIIGFYATKWPHAQFSRIKPAKQFRFTTSRD